jgi:hypothetical protein
MGSGDKESFDLLGPKAEIIESDRPTLRWTSYDGATGYIVNLQGADGRLILENVPSKVNSLQVKTPLKRGGKYVWQSFAIVNGQEVESRQPEARFYVLEQNIKEEIAQARKIYAGRPLILGTLYSKAGLLKEAEEEFKILIRQNPKSNQALKLLVDIRTARRQVE